MNGPEATGGRRDDRKESHLEPLRASRRFYHPSLRNSPTRTRDLPLKSEIHAQSSVKTSLSAWPAFRSLSPLQYCNIYLVGHDLCAPRICRSPAAPPPLLDPTTDSPSSRRPEQRWCEDVALARSSPLAWLSPRPHPDFTGCPVNLLAFSS